MARNKHTTVSRGFKHLSLDLRGAIAALKNEGYSQRDIANKIGVHHSTVSRELKRGTVTQLNYDLTTKEAYFPDAGQRVYDENRSMCGTKFKVAQVGHFLDHAEEMARKENWSPDVIVGAYRKDPKTKNLPCICTKTLYAYIDQGFLGIRNIDLYLKVRRKTKTKKVRQNKRILGESIEQRPHEVSTRETFGHWEIDTVIGKRSHDKACLTLLERKTREFLIRPLEQNTVECVSKALEEIRNDFGDMFSKVFKTITGDNGSEFYDLSSQLDEYGSKAYFCHPYSSWEKGANEKHNSLIRRFLPKGTAFTDLTLGTVKRIQNWCNQLPRKILGYSTPGEAFYKELAIIE